MAALLEELGTLDESQLREVVSRASFLLDPTAKANAPARAAKPLDKDVDLVWTGASAALSRAGNAPPLSVVLRNKRLRGLLETATEKVMALVRDGFKVEHRAERVKVVRLLVGLTVADLARRDALNTLRLLQRLHYVERTVDRHFPGYRTSHLLSLVVQQVKA